MTNAIDFHRYLGELLKKCFRLIGGNDIYSPTEDYSDIPQFDHADFQLLGLSAQQIGERVAALRKFDFGTDSDIPLCDIVEKAGHKYIHLGNLSWEDVKDLKSPHLEAKLQTLFHANKSNNYYFPQITKKKNFCIYLNVF